MSHKQYRQEPNCLNCGANVQGKYCQECGQENLETRENFLHMAGHFIADYLHFDSKFFRSLFPLFLKPGFLTRQYWDGKRAHYIHPLRIFFFVTIIFMISTTLFYKKFGAEVKRSIILPDKELAIIKKSFLDSSNDNAKIYFKGDSITVADLKIRKATEARQLEKLSSGFDAFFNYLKYITFFLLPVYALIFKLLYLRKKSFYVDHLVYTIHLQTFIYSLLSIIVLLPFVFPESLHFISNIILFSIFVYIAFSLYYLYRQVWWKTLVKSLMSTMLLFFITAMAMVFYALFDMMFIQ